MTFTLTSSAPIDGEAILALDDAKLHLRAIGGDEDALIEALRLAAIDWVERHTGVALSRRAFVYSGNGFGAMLHLPVRPVVSVSSVTYRDAAGVSTIMGAGTYRHADGRIYPAARTAWPYTARESGAVVVQFVAGLADILVEAPALQAAVKLLLGHLYVNREAVVTGETAAELPFSIQALCAPYRLPVL